MTEREKCKRAVETVNYLIAAYTFDAGIAEDLGYALEILNKVDKKYSIKPEKLLPCVCGGVRRETWFFPEGECYECIKCGRKSEMGKTDKEKRANWNRMVMQEQEGRR